MKKINLFLISIMFLGSYLFYQYLPAQLPMHWNIMGQVDNYMPKNQAVLLMPTMTLFIWILFLVLPNFDPKKDKYKLFQKEWQIIQTTFIGFFFYLHFLIFYISTNSKVQMLPFMFIGLGTFFILLGNYLSKIRQNYFIGVKTPWSLSSEDNWNKTHRYASWCFVIAGIVTLIEATFVWHAPVVIFGSIMLASILPMVYSFLLFKKKPNLIKYVYFAIIAFVILLFSARLISGEDNWICVKGKWIKHGKPSAPMPKIGCKNN